MFNELSVKHKALDLTNSQLFREKMNYLQGKRHRAMDFEILRKFCLLAEEKNFSSTSKQLNMAQSTLSRSISSLEDQLKICLFTRKNNGLELTPKGEQFLEHAKLMVHSNEIFLKKFCEDESLVEGDLKVVAFPYLGSQWLIPRIDKFLKAYPKINLSIHTESEIVNPYNYDVALGVYIPNQPNLIQKELFPDYNKFFSSEEYLNTYGIPEKAEDLDNHRLITYGGQDSYSAYRSINLLMNVGLPAYSSPRKPYLEIDSLSGMINAVLAGYGIAELPRFAAVHYPELKPVLPRILNMNEIWCIKRTLYRINPRDFTSKKT